MRKIEVLQLKRGTKAKLTERLCGEFRPKDGEPIWEEDTGKLKFGDGIHDYGELEYFNTTDFVVEGALDGNTLIYNAEVGRWESKKFIDGKSIQYGDDGLKIAGFTGEREQQGRFPIVNDGNINWQTAVTDETLAIAVDQARVYAYTASQGATNAELSATQARTAAGQAEQFRDATAALLANKFWFGTRSEYESEIINQGKLREGTIYFIREYDWTSYQD